MATISSLGIGSGLDLSGIVDSLVEAERAPTESRLNSQEESISTKLSAFGALKSSLSLFQGSLTNLSSNTFNSNSATVSDESVLSTFATSFADPGTYSVEVTTLAKSHSLATNAATAFETVDDTVGTGTMTIQFGTTTTDPYTFTSDTSKANQVIEVSEANGNTTLSGLRDYINEGDFGISASIVNDGNGYRLTLTSENTGASNSMEITITDDGDGIQDDNAGLSQLAFNSAAQSSLTQTVEATDAQLTVNGLEITRDTNSVAGAIGGVTLNLLKADVGNVISVKVGADTASVKTAITEFVDGYNGLMTNINSLTAYDSQDNSVGILLGDFTVRSVTNQIRSVLSTSIAQFSSDFQSLADIGIKTTSEGTLSLNSATLDGALSNSPDDVASIFAKQGRATDSGVSYISSTSDTLSGSYFVNITEMASQGVLTAATINSLTIDANNDVFKIRVDGTNSGDITLTQGDYASGAALATHLQAQINNDSSLKAAGASVIVSYDSLNNNFNITSQKFGSTSSVALTSVDTNSASTIGLSILTGTTGVDVTGTINGQAAEGSGQLLTSTSGDSYGLVVSVTSGNAGNRGTLSLTNGIIDSLDNLLTTFLGSNGYISNREDGFNKELDEIATLRLKLDERINSLEARLVQQFSALDTLVSKYQATSNYLVQQLDSLVKPNSINGNN